MKLDDDVFKLLTHSNEGVTYFVIKILSKSIQPMALDPQSQACCWIVRHSFIFPDLCSLLPVLFLLALLLSPTPKFKFVYLK